MTRESPLRNIAIIAHVDHGKTTLVDALLVQSGAVPAHRSLVERAMDSNDLERERGITIFSKNASVEWKGVRINIVDTPGHADFGGEVERVLEMVDGALLLVDASEGPMPQTTFVLRKAFAAGLAPIVVFNKIDRPDARPDEVLNETFDLFVRLGANEKQLDFPYLWTIARRGIARASHDGSDADLGLLFDTILARVPAPVDRDTEPFQMRVATIQYDNYVGRAGIGRVLRGRIQMGDRIAWLRRNGTATNFTPTKLFGYRGLDRVEVLEAGSGDIVAIAGAGSGEEESVEIGETFADLSAPEALPRIPIDPPTVSMLFRVNDSPLAGREGNKVTSRVLRDRLYKELRSNLALRVEETNEAEAFRVIGRGELHLGILLETMRREGFELAVGRPEVVLNERGEEPFEEAVVLVPENYQGAAMSLLGPRRAEILDIRPDGKAGVRLSFRIPARGLFGLRSDFLSATRGEGVLTHAFLEFAPPAGPIPGRTRGVMCSMDAGTVIAYAMEGLAARGTFFVEPGDPVYMGMIVGENAKEHDIEVNVCRSKKLTNHRASQTDKGVEVPPSRKMSLEEALVYLAEDELLEITPTSLRLRKKFRDANDRKRLSRDSERALEREVQTAGA